MTTITFGQLGPEHEGRILRTTVRGQTRIGKPEDIAHYLNDPNRLTSVRFKDQTGAVFGNHDTPIEIVDERGPEMQPIVRSDGGIEAATEAIAAIVGRRAGGDVFTKRDDSVVKLNRAGLASVVEAVQRAALADVRAVVLSLGLDLGEINHEEDNEPAGYSHALDDLLSFIDDGIDNEESAALFAAPEVVADELERLQRTIDGND